MVEYIFFRLCRKNRHGAGRRYYRLLAYPHDRAVLDSGDAAIQYARARRYAAILAPGHQWIALDDRAQDCVRWHTAGKSGYIISL